MKVTNVLVNYGVALEASHEVDEPLRALPYVVAMYRRLYPDCTSMVITLVADIHPKP